MTLLDEGEIVLNEEIYKHPVSKVHGGCEECQRLLTVYPTKTDVGLSQTEDLYVMMPMDWSEPIDWGRWRRREHNKWDALFFILRCLFCITYGTKNTELYFMYTSAFDMYTFESEEYLTECNGGSHHAQTLA